MFSLAKDRPVIRTTSAIVRSSSRLSGFSVCVGRFGLAEREFAGPLSLCED